MPPFNLETSRFGKVVRKKRLKKGWGLRQFARMLDLSPTYISLMERGEQPPPREVTICQMAIILDLNVDMLLAEAGKVSTELKEIIIARPVLVADILRAIQGKQDEELEALKKSLQTPCLQNGESKGLAALLRMTQGCSEAEIQGVVAAFQK